MIRETMRKHYPLISLALYGLCAMAMSSQAAEGKPNIVLILSDDMGYADIGAHGCKDIPTPHIDRIAAEGVRFTDAYANGSFCTPTRAALISGAYQQRCGNEDLTSVTGPLPRAVRTLPDRLRKAGYTTAMVGKWHLGEKQDFTPLDRGFDEFVDSQREAKKPFFLYLAFNAVHTPLQATDKYLQRFAHIEDRRRRTYAAMLSAMDDAIGLVMKQLAETGKLKNTLVMFHNDNGGPTTRNAVNGSRNTPLRGSKCETFEGGIRVPLAMQWPGVIEAGAVYRQPVITFDLTATVLATAGADAAGVEGVDLMPFLTGDKRGVPHESLYWRCRTRNNNYAMRLGEWKFVHSTEGAEQPGPRQKPARDMLFNLREDIAEQHDLAAQHPEKLAELKKLYEAWSAEVDADCRKLGIEPRGSKPPAKKDRKPPK